MTSLARNHAVVLGASMAGLTAARALADHFTQVTLIDRDQLPDVAAARKGVPQSRHTHGLLSSGRNVLEAFFPGFTSEIEAEGAIIVDNARDLRFHLGGGYLAHPSEPSELLSILVTRPKLEGHVRKRLLALPNVQAIEGCEVLGLETSADRRQVVGVRVRRAETQLEEVLSADLVVDATGRGSRTPAWLESLGYQAPAEEQVEINLAYATQVFRRTTPLTPGAIAVVGSSRQGALRSGLFSPIEDDRWIVSLTGYLGDHPPADADGFRAFAKDIPTPEVRELIEQAEPLGEPIAYRFQSSKRRRYERLREFPEGLLVTGDAICSFNPVYGQGMSVAALEAAALGECLARGTDGLARRFFARAARIVDTPWSLAVGADLRFPEIDAPRTPMSRFLNWYTSWLQRAAHRDPKVAVTFLRVSNLIDSPHKLLSPVTLFRVFWANLCQALEKLPTPSLEYAGV